MGKEFKILKELSTISATAIELAGINRIICAEIGSADFREEYDSLIGDIRATYQVVLDTLAPLENLLTAEDFASRFDAVCAWYKAEYQPALSQPRIFAEFTYEKYLQFRKRKETKTGYPALKAVFMRLHDLIDKWIDNDIWLAMCIDGLFKQLNLLMEDVADALRRDPEEGLALYQSCVGGFGVYTAAVSAAIATLPEQVITDKSKLAGLLG